MIKTRYAKMRSKLTKLDQNYTSQNKRRKVIDTSISNRYESQEFISSFIKCEQQRLSYKPHQSVNETIQQVLFYIQSTSPGMHKTQDFKYNNFVEQRIIKKSQLIRSKEVDEQVKQLKSIEVKKPEIFVARRTHVKLKSSITTREVSNIKLKSKSIKNHNLTMRQSKDRQIQQKKQILQKKSYETKLNRPILFYDPKELSHIKSESYCIMEYPTNQLILSCRSKVSLEIASLTKIMTCYVVLKIIDEHCVDITTQKIMIREFVEAVSGTSADLAEGDILTLQQLLYGLMLPSGNDAAVALATWGGTKLDNRCTQKQEAKRLFIQQMNKKAKELELLDTYYANPHGLPHPQSRSTAYDVCKLISMCMQIPLFNKIINTKQYKANIDTNYKIRRTIQWQNTNKLLRREGFRGVKTGITVTAGPCLSSAYQFKDRVFIIVLLRANKISRRFTQTRKILYWALQKLYKGILNTTQTQRLEELKKKRRELDSDNSDQEEQFVYNEASSDELSRRNRILKNQL